MPESYTEDERELLDLAYLHALDAVSEIERGQITDRLGAAAPHTAHEFARIVADTHETLALITITDATTPPPHLRERILQAIGVQDAGPVDELTAKRIRRRRVVSRAVLAAAAACVIGVAATVVVNRFDHHTGVSALTVEQVLASPDIRTLSAPVAGGTMTLRASAKANAVVVSMADVPPPPQDHVYQMWFLPPTGTPRSAGTMGATTMPPPGGEVIPALDSAAKVAVTVEPGTGSPQPTSTPVVVISLA